MMGNQNNLKCFEWNVCVLFEAPAETFFELRGHITNYLNGWVKMDNKVYNEDVMQTDWCIHREFRVYNGSMFKVQNTKKYDCKTN